MPPVRVSVKKGSHEVGRLRAVEDKSGTNNPAKAASVMV
jgi:hypothetical protein